MEMEINFQFCTTATFTSMVKDMKWVNPVTFIRANYPNPNKISQLCE